MQIKEIPVWTFRVSGKQENKARSVVRAHDVKMMIDEPIERGGTNLRPMPVETMIMGPVGCTHVIPTSWPPTKMDSSGTRPIQPIDMPFPEVKLTTTAEMDGSNEVIDMVISKLRHHRAVSKMLQMSGVKATATGAALLFEAVVDVDDPFDGDDEPPVLRRHSSYRWSSFDERTGFCGSPFRHQERARSRYHPSSSCPISAASMPTSGVSGE